MWGADRVLTDPFSLFLAACAGLLALAAGWIQFPRPPALDGERWFKLALATVLRGRLEPAGVDAWERAVARQVLYHPAGRLPERKLSNPVASELPTKALPGELALITALAARPDPEARLRYLYEEDPSGLDARLSDPEDLGEDYAFTVLGPEASWDALAAWGADRTDAFVATARRRVPATWVLVAGRPERQVGAPVLAALAAILPDAIRLDHGADVIAAVRPHLEDLARRVVLVAEEASVADLLRLLVARMDLREQVAAVVSIGGVIGGRADEDGTYGAKACEDWVEANFKQVSLDTDVVRLTPYFCAQWLAPGVWPPGVPGLPVQASRFPEPNGVGAPVTTVEVVDLGLLPVDADADAVARALVAVVCAWVASRR